MAAEPMATMKIATATHTIASPILWRLCQR